MTTRAVIYTRISSDRTGAGLGVGSQERDCRELADRLGWTVVAVHSDNDVSAYSGKPRPGYRALLDALHGGSADAVLAWHEDRLHRSTRELEDYIDACEPRGISTHFVRSGVLDLTTASGRMTARIRGAVARGEAEHMRERVEAAKQRSANAGRWKGGRRPFGYEADGVTVREDEAALVREGSAAVLAGASMRGMAGEWNASGVSTTTGKPWDMTGVRRILLRPRNAGLMEHRGEVVGKAEWPAIVPEEQWRAVVRVLSDPARRSNGKGVARKWLGSGLYRCDVCGEGVVTTMSKGGGASEAHRVYRCRDSHVSKSQVEVDLLVEAVVCERLRQPDALRRLAAPVDEGPDVEALEAEAVTLRSRLDELAALFAAGTIDGQQLGEGTARLNEDLGRVREAISAVYGGTALQDVADAPDPASAWLDAPLERRRAVLDALVAVTLLRSPGGRPPGWKPGESYFRPETVRFDWRS